MSGSTSVAPLASLLAKKYLKVSGHCVKFKLLQGGSDIGITDVAAGRVTIGNSSRDPKPSDPGGLVFNKIARDAVCIVTNNANPIARHRPGRRPGHLRRPRPQLEQRPGRERQRARSTLFVRTPASGTQDAFQNIFLGPTKIFARRQPEGLQRPGPADGQVGPERDRLRLARLHQRRAHGPLQGRRLHPAQRQVRPVRRRAQLLHGHPRRRQGRGQGVDQLDQAQRRRPPRSSAPTGCRCTSEAGRPAAAAAAARRGPHATGAPSSLLGALVLRGPAADRAAWSSSSSPRRGRRSPTTAWPGSAPAATSTEQLDDIFNSPGRPERLRLHAARLAAALRDRADHRRRGR